MEGKPRPLGEVAAIFATVIRLANKHGQIGNCSPEDIAQNVMMKVLKLADDREITFGWLYKAVQSSAYDAGRSYKREAQHRCFFLETEESGSVCEMANENGYLSIGADYLSRQDHERDPYLARRLQWMLQKLPNPLRDALILYAADWSYKEIAEKTHAKIGTVRSRVHYARKQAKTMLRDFE